MLFGDAGEGSKFTKAGIGQNNIDSTLHLTDGVVQTIKVGQSSNVSLNAGYVAADCLHGLVELLLATASDENVGTLLDEQLCRSRPIPSVPPVMTATFPFNLPSDCGISFNVDIKDNRFVTKARRALIRVGLWPLVPAS